MAGTIKRTNPGDAANIFVRCMLSDISDLLGGFSREDLERTVEYFDYKCPYTGEDISVEYSTGKWVLDHLIPHNRESLGLNLYGNIIVTTKNTNSAKSAKNFEDFIRYETQGSSEEKELRIKKIRQFQKESGYFEKIKNIDDLKDLCKSEYDFVQNRLKSHQADYETILEFKKPTTENRSKRIFVVDPNAAKKEAVNPNLNRTMTLKAPNNAGAKISKSEAIRLIRNNGIEIFGNITFSSRNSGSYVYWANPNIRYLLNDWWIILNDYINRIIHVLCVPAGAINPSEVVVRADKPDLMDIQIGYNDSRFIDTRSKITFDEWLIDSIQY